MQPDMCPALSFHSFPKKRRNEEGMDREDTSRRGREICGKWKFADGSFIHEGLLTIIYSIVLIHLEDILMSHAVHL